MNRRIITLFLLLLVAAALPAHAYNEFLHHKMAGYAFDQTQSELNFTKRYGWDDLPGVLRTALQYGALHEDDLPNSLNHFFDPQAKIPLTEKAIGPFGIPICTALGVPADDWALESPANPRGWAAANDHFFDALTLKARSDRTFAAGDFFEDLGHIIHLVEDMAQPEHTRNDQHLSLYFIEASFGDVAASLYENWTRDHLLSPNFLPDGTPTSAFFEGYPMPPAQSGLHYNRHAFFHSNHALFGLASYSSYNHVTQDTNYDDDPWCATHLAPHRQFAVPREEPTVITVIDPATGLGEQITVIEKIYSYDMRDFGTGRLDSDGYHSILSAIDHEAQKYGKRVFSLDDDSWKSRAANLVPKAVGYSAAVIGHFFRGNPGSFWWAKDDATYQVWMRMFPDRSNVQVGMWNATAYIYREDEQGNLALLAPPKVVPLLGSFDVLLAEVPNMPDLYRYGLRVVLRGSMGSGSSLADEGAVAAQVFPPKNEIKVVIEYEAGYTYGNTRFQVINQGGNAVNCAGCSTIAMWPAMLHSMGVPFSHITKPPFNGKIEFSVGAADNQRFFSQLNLDQVSEPGRMKMAIVSIYRNGEFKSHHEIPYTTGLSKQIRFDGAGALTISN